MTSFALLENSDKVLLEDSNSMVLENHIAAIVTYVLMALLGVG